MLSKQPPPDTVLWMPTFMNVGIVDGRAYVNMPNAKSFGLIQTPLTSHMFLKILGTRWGWFQKTGGMTIFSAW
jgi:hypothetical protein